MPKTLCFDLDGTLCSNTFGAYESAEPLPWAIARVNALALAGHRIVILTARGSASGIDWSDRTRTQLQRWGVHYDELVFGKPSADVYIDDRALHTMAWRTGDAFGPPGFAPEAASEELPTVLAPHVSWVVEAGRTFGGRPIRLMQHVRRALAAASAAGLRVASDPVAASVALDARVRACIADRTRAAGGDVVYLIALADAPTSAHLDISPADALPAAVSCRPLADVVRALEPFVAPGAGTVHLRARISTAPHRPADAWPLVLGPNGSVADGLGCQLGIFRDGTLRLESPAGPPPVAGTWLRSLATDGGVRVEGGQITEHELASADEVLIVGLPFCLVPVAAINDREVRTGRRTGRLLDAWSAEVGVDVAAQTAELVRRPEVAAR